MDAEELKKDREAAENLSMTKDQAPETTFQDADAVADVPAVTSDERTSQYEYHSAPSSECLDSALKDEKLSDPVPFKVMYNKNRFDVEFSLDATVAQLKQHLEPIIQVPPAMQKLMIKGLAKEEMTLKACGLTEGGKVMAIGSTLNDVLQVSKPAPKVPVVEGATSSSTKEPLSQQKQHKKIIEKGPPDDVLPGIKNSKDSLPPFPISGMVNKHGGKVRLTFKLEADQLWIGTKERTDKIPMNTIKAIMSEPIVDHEEYHIMGIQLGPTEASRYWVYWVPAQYIDAIKDAVLGKWQYF
ncbi:unnamed protein product [Darwinula stevensoni]|uniref:Ubiquitin-like domain-containing protein n=1 Tax=Darwinula stevensoni TaxID=69355 RepID=A0A7R8X4X5_9CRUS|nr:unnamed protein product [Darwinula stevensoni]CAG0879523.1 unnamed protein product [Darwinula stevensoni]